MRQQLPHAVHRAVAFVWIGLIRPLSAPLVLACASSSLLSFFPGPLFLLLLLVGALVLLPWLATLLILAIAALVQGAWMRFGASCVRLAAFVPVVLVGLFSGDYVHLVLLYPHYRAVIAQHPGEVVRFPWGDAAATVLDGIQLIFLVYDPTDGGQRADQPIPGDELRTARRKHLIGRFYVECDGSC